MAEGVGEKITFISKLPLLMKATADDSEPMPGYMYSEVCKISFESGAYCQELADWLVDRLSKRSCNVRQKVLKIIKYTVTNGHPLFVQCLRKKSQVITDCTKFSGPPDPLHGSAPYLSVRQEAEDLLRLLFTFIENESTSNLSSAPVISSSGIGSVASSRGSGMQGFGNTVTPVNRSLGDTILSSLQEFAASVVDTSATGHRDDITFIPPQSSRAVGNFPGYKPVTVPETFVDGEPDEGRQQSVKTNRSQSQPKKTSVHRPGVAGGGWDDEYDDQSGSVCTSSSSDVVSDRLGDVSKLEDWSCEIKVTNSFTFSVNAPYPGHSELKEFIESCASINCEKVVELLNASLNISAVVPTMRAMLAIEALLRTDLVSPEHITLTCHQNLCALYTSTSSSFAVQQKARKIIRILEKLAPKHADLFSSVPAKSANIMHRSDDSSCDKNAECATSNSADDSDIVDDASDIVNFTSVAFPFLLSSSAN